MYSKEELHNTFTSLYEGKGKAITFKEASEALGCCETTLRKNMKAVDGYENCPDVFIHILKPIHVFDNMNEETAYWLGYLMADGCYTNISKNENVFRLMLECKIEDREILEKFCDFLQIRKERITLGHNGRSAALSMADSVFTTSVSNYGIVKNKSHIEHHIPIEIKENKNFFFQYLRGLIDGDGTIHYYTGSKGVSLVDNSKIFLEEIKKELEKYLPEPSSIWIIEKTIEQQKGRNATQSLFSLKIGTGKIKHSNMNYLYNQFYTNQKIILSRKEEIFKTIL